MLPLIGRPGGGVDIGDIGDGRSCATHTTLINTNKIEAIFLLCSVVIESIYKKRFCKMASYLY